MYTVFLEWINFKSDIIDKGFSINYKKTNTGYEVFVIERNILWICPINDSLDITDFEENYKTYANKNTTTPRTSYKSSELDVTDDWQDIDLGNTYLDITLSLRAKDSIEIKLNNSDNDIIILREDYPDAQIQELKVSKIYYKTKELDKTSKLFYMALK